MSMTANKIPVTVPNEFSLTDGKEVSITYSTITGEPQLDYKTQVVGSSGHFSGKEINQQVTQIGTLLTVTLSEEVFGAQVTKALLSVLLPDVNLGVVGEKNPVQTDVKTEAILTTQKIGRSVPEFIGQTQIYQFLPLTGTARFVE